MPVNELDCGSVEGFKGSIHVVGAGTMLLCAGYNVMAWSQRRKPYLLRNALLYACMTIWEVVQVRRHWIREGITGLSLSDSSEERRSE